MRHITAITAITAPDTLIPIPPTKVTPFFIFTNIFYFFQLAYSTFSIWLILLFPDYSTFSPPDYSTFLPSFRPFLPFLVGNFSLTPEDNIFRNFSRHFLRIPHHYSFLANLTDLDT